MINLKTDIMAKTTPEEIANIYKWCFENMTKVYDDGGNWTLFQDSAGFVWSIAKPGSGAKNSLFGNKNYFERYLRAKGGIRYGTRRNESAHIYAADNRKNCQRIKRGCRASAAQLNSRIGGLRQ